MLRLSRQAWNNVLIFSMLIMIMLFNGLHKKLGGEAVETKVSLLPENSLLLTLKLQHTQVERIGQSWRANPIVAMDESQLTQLMNTWLSYSALLQPLAEEAKVMTQGKMPEHYVVATLAGKDDGAVYAFYPQLEWVWVHDQSLKRWLKMPIDELELLFPAPLLKLSP